MLGYFSLHWKSSTEQNKQSSFCSRKGGRGEREREKQNIQQVVGAMEKKKQRGLMHMGYCNLKQCSQESLP